MKESTGTGSGRLPESIRRLREALARAPDNAELHHRLGLALLQVDQSGASGVHLRRAVELAPGDAGYLVVLARYLDRQRRHDEAAERYQQALQLQPGDTAMRWRLACMQRRTGQMDAAITTLRRLLQDAPADHRALGELGTSYWQRGDTDAAAEMFTAALAQCPDDMFARTALASLRAEAGHPDPQAARVALHMSRAFHHAVLMPVFEQLHAAGHAVRLTGEPVLLRQFAPRVIVSADLQGRRLQELAPGAQSIYVRHGLTSKNHLPGAGASCDFLAGITSPHMAEMLVRDHGLAPDRIWVTGHVPLDPLFTGSAPPLPFQLPAGRPTILFAPTWNRYLSAADLTRERTVALLRGATPGANVIIKPHPHTARLRPDWMEALRAAARDQPGVVVADDPAMDVVPLLAAADVLVSDVSSVIFSFLALDRPIVLLTHPLREQDPGYDPGGIEWRWRDVGAGVTDVAALPRAVADALANPRRNAGRRAHYRDLLFGEFTDGRAAQRIAERIGELRD